MYAVVIKISKTPRCVGGCGLVWFGGSYGLLWCGCVVFIINNNATLFYQVILGILPQLRGPLKVMSNP